MENSEELVQSKLLLLYIIDESENSLTNEEITEFLLENNYMNYFLIQQYLSELIESGFIEYINKKDKKIYVLLDKGKTTLSYFEDRISENIKNKISSKFIKTKKDQKIATQVIGEYFEKGTNKYIANLKLIENTETLFSLYLNVATAEQAKKICNTWKKNTETIYKNLLNMLADDNITSIEE